MVISIYDWAMIMTCIVCGKRQKQLDIGLSPFLMVILIDFHSGLLPRLCKTNEDDKAVEYAQIVPVRALVCNHRDETRHFSASPPVMQHALPISMGKNIAKRKHRLESVFLVTTAIRVSYSFFVWGEGGYL